MRSNSIALFAALICVSSIAAAQSVPPPTPGGAQGGRNPVMSDNSRYDRLRSIDMLNPKGRAERHPLLDPDKGIYRRPGKSEIAALAVPDELRSRHAAFLKQPNTGIVKLNADSTCVSDGVVSADVRCIPFAMPGAGAAFSFRTKSYRLPRLADIILINGIFQTGGVFQQVAIAEIGDITVDQANLTTAGLKFLVDMQPVANAEEFGERERTFRKGIKADGFLYNGARSVKHGTTYVLRSIAYRGELVRSIDGLQYNELDFDKRTDVIVAFRVVDRDQAGNPTIIWKTLKDKESPMLKVN